MNYENYFDPGLLNNLGRGRFDLVESCAERMK
jgi:hypothetical protein